MGNPNLHQPVREGEEVPRHGAKGLQFRNAFGLLASRVRDKTAGRDTLLVDLQPCAMGKHPIHGASPSGERLAGYPEVARLPCVLDFLGEDGDSAWCRQVSRSS